MTADLLGQIDALQLGLHRRFDRSALLHRQFRQRLAATRLGKVVLGQGGEAHKIGGRVILPEIRPHAVEAAVIHQVGFLEAGLPDLDVGRRHQNRAIAGNKPVGKGRSGLVGEVCRPAEDPETPDGNYQQDPFEHVAHRILCGPIDPVCFQRHALALPLSSRLSRRLLICSTRLRRDACSVETQPVKTGTFLGYRRRPRGS
jgi:hypothetical protein